MCKSPLFISRPNKPNKGDTVPCGKCSLCMKKHYDSWNFRLNKELERSSSAHFVTLTYNDENLKALNKRDIQLFMKRLRKLEPNKLKYFLVGEHGSKFGRPHYHAIIFNLTDPDNIQKAWNMGFTYAPPVRSTGSISYTLKYIYKATNYERFTMMSKNLGSNYTEKMKEFHAQDIERCYVINNGFKKSMPKYYKERIYSETQRKQVTEYLHKRSEELDLKLKYALGETGADLNASRNKLLEDKPNSNIISNLDELVAKLSKR